MLAYTLGAFNFDSSGFYESYRTFSQKRVKAVTRSPTWKLAVNVPPISSIGQEYAKGIEEAVDWVNAEGGILGKRIELVMMESSEDFMENKFRLQGICENPEIALAFAPWSTAELLSSRALSQFQALPLVSTTLENALPGLNPELHLSVLPPLEMLTSSLIEKLVESGYRRVLIVSTDREYYGGVFTSRLERDMGMTDFFLEIFRSDYVPPAEFQALHKALRFYLENTTLDVILFTGDMEDLVILWQVMRDLQISVPVFGTNLLDTPSLAGLAKQHGGSDLYYLSVNCSLPPSTGAGNGVPTAAGVWFRYGVLSVLLFRDALLDQGDYVPDKLVESMEKRFQALGSPQGTLFQVTMKHISGESGSDMPGEGQGRGEF